MPFALKSQLSIDYELRFPFDNYFELPLKLDDSTEEGKKLGRFFHEGYSKYVPFQEDKIEIPEELKEFIPTRFVFLSDSAMDFPDIFNHHDNLIMSQRVKDKLEELEPGAHDFFPITLEFRLAKDSPSYKEIEGHYLVYVGQRPDIIDFDEIAWGRNFERGLAAAIDTQFDYQLLCRQGEDFYDPYDLERVAHIKFTSPDYNGHHLWRATAGAKGIELYEEKNGDISYVDRFELPLLMSDTFADFLTTEKISGGHLFTVLDQPMSWVEEQIEAYEWQWLNDPDGY